MTAEREQHQEHVAAHDGEEAEQSLHEGRIGVGPGDQLTGRHAVEVVEIHHLEVVVHGVAQVVLHAERHRDRRGSGGCRGSRTRPTARATRRTSHGQSDEVWVTITPSTIWRSMRGTMVWQTLPRPPPATPAPDRGGAAACNPTGDAPNLAVAVAARRRPTGTDRMPRRSAAVRPPAAPANRRWRHRARPATPSTGRGRGSGAQRSSIRRIISASTRAKSAWPSGVRCKYRHPLVSVDGRPEQQSALRQGLDSGAHRRLADGQSIGHPRGPLVARRQQPRAPGSGPGSTPPTPVRAPAWPEAKARTASTCPRGRLTDSIARQPTKMVRLPNALLPSDQGRDFFSLALWVQWV